MTDSSDQLPAAAGVDDLTFGFMAKLRRLFQAYSAAWSTEVSSTVTPPQFGVLTELGRQPGQDQQTLARTLSMDKSTAADVVRRLTGRGLVQVLRDPQDNRRKILVLTEAGRSARAELTVRVNALRQRTFAVLSDEQAAGFVQSVETLIAGLETHGRVQP